ncbi:MAG: lytic transglycosylase domain-containing protein [Treponema sp.]|jgi:soluble lytic murein transglycosylase|nr:lytic transglycosylase domain-containing protein [Treponema sp.]
MLCSCHGKPLLDIPRNEALKRLKEGDITFVLEAKPAALMQFGKTNPEAAFFIGLLVKASGGYGSNTEADFREGLLFEAALNSRSPRTRGEAARELISPLLNDKELAGRILERLDQKDAPPLLGSRTVPGTAGIAAGTEDVSEQSLRAAVFFSLGRFAEAVRVYEEEMPLCSWDKALSLIASLAAPETIAEGVPDAENVAEGRDTAAVMDFFLLNPVDDAYRWARDQLDILLKKKPALLSAGECAAIDGKAAIARSNYGEGLKNFRSALESRPELFFRYPDLLIDLGRAFQYSGARERETGLLLDWDGLLEAGPPGGNSGGADKPETKDTKSANAEQGFSIPEQTWDDPALPLIRYRLLLYAGRIERQRSRHKEAAALFLRALSFAPGPNETDACIWYFLSENLAYQPENTPSITLEYIPRWQDISYYEDFLDDLSSYLCAQGQWKALLQVFYAIRRGAEASITAQYAFLIGRALQEGFLTPDELKTAGMEAGTEGETRNTVNTAAQPDTANSAENGTETGSGPNAGKGGAGEDTAERERAARYFFSIAGESPRAVFYYRVLSSSYLGGNLTPVVPNEKPAKKKPDVRKFPHADDVGFFLNFFEYGASSLLAPYILTMKDELSIDELRTLASAYAAAELWYDANRVISYYENREDYTLTLEDMLINYPHPLSGMIEGRALEMGMPAPLLYGLIRTESLFQSEVVSRAGAVGMTQLMPATAVDMAGRMAKAGVADYMENGAVNMKDPAVNIHIGAFYLNYLINNLKSPLLALAAYNGGMGRVKRWREARSALSEDLFIETIEFRETRMYGKRILGSAAIYGYLYYGMSMEAVIADIYNIRNKDI